MEIFQKGMSIALVEETWKDRGATYQFIGRIIYKQLEGTKSLSASALMLLSGGCKRGVRYRGDTPSGRTGESKTASGNLAPYRRLQHQQFLFQVNHSKTKPTQFLLPRIYNLIKSAVSIIMRQPYTCGIITSF